MAVRGGSRRENQTTLETYEKHADSSIRRMAGTPREAVCAWRDEGVLDQPCHAQILEIGDGPGRDARYIESRAQRTAKRRRGAVYPLPLARETRYPSPEHSHGPRRAPSRSMVAVPSHRKKDPGRRGETLTALRANSTCENLRT